MWNKKKEENICQTFKKYIKLDNIIVKKNYQFSLK